MKPKPRAARAHAHHPKPARRWWSLSPTQQIFAGLVAGVLIGVAAPQWTRAFELPRDIFLHLVKVMIAPLVFASIVQGIAGSGDMKKVGRIGGKALLYFEIITTVALVVGLLAVNLLQPGAGVTLPGSADSVSATAQNRPLTLTETILHTFPTSLIDAMARNDVLQIVAFSVLFAMAVIAAGEAGKPVLKFCDSLTHVMFKFAGFVMKAAPIGVGAAMAATVGKQGVDVLFGLGKVIFTLYVALGFFVVVVFGAVMAIARVPVKPFLRAMREPFTIAFSTTSSEAALPKAFALLEKFGVPRGIIGFVLPAGYTFNLDGTTLYLAVASVFVAQAAGIHLSIEHQVTMMLTLMMTSKGVAAVPRAALVVLIATLQSLGLPLEGAALLLGVDALMDMARTGVNMLGNSLAAVVVARWEGEFDETMARKNFGDGAPPVELAEEPAGMLAPPLAEETNAGRTA